MHSVQSEEEKSDRLKLDVTKYENFIKNFILTDSRIMKEEAQHYHKLD